MTTRPLTSLTLQLTTRCNLRCVHCYSPPKGGNRDPDLSTEFALGVLEDAGSLGVERVAILGGEPLIRKDLALLIQKAVDCGLDPDVVTNGMLLTDDRLRELVDAGIKHFTVSIDGLRHGHNLMRGRDNFEATLETIQRLGRSGLGVKVNTVVTRHNLSELDALAGQLSDWCDVHKLIFYTPSGPAGSEIWVGPEEWVEQAQELQRDHALGSSRLLVQQPFQRATDEGMCRLSAPFVAATGDVFPCVTLVETPRSIGSLYERRFLDIWQGAWPMADSHDHCIGYSEILTGELDGDFREELPMADWDLGCPLFCTQEIDAKVA